MKNISVSPSSLAIGALLTAGLLVVMGQAGPGSYGSWGPPKKSVVNVFVDQAMNVPAGANVVIYQVPSDRWLTLTGATLSGGGALRWSEQLGGAFTNKGFADIDATHSLKSTPAGGGAEVGWVFRPGSQVVLRNPASVDVLVNHYALIGYESRD